MEEKKLTYRDFIDMVRADNKAKNADRATRKNLYVDAKNKYEDYLRGEWEKDKQSTEEKKYVNEAGQFDFKKFVADGALEKNLNESVVNEANIRDDIQLLIKDLIEKGIIIKGYRTSTGNSARGKYKVYVFTDNLTYDAFNELIKDNYKQTGTTNFSSKVFYSPKGKVYFYFYPDGDNGRFVLLVRRKNLKN